MAIVYIIGSIVALFSMLMMGVHIGLLIALKIMEDK